MRTVSNGWVNYIQFIKCLKKGSKNTSFYRWSHIRCQLERFSWIQKAKNKQFWINKIHLKIDATCDMRGRITDKYARDGGKKRYQDVLHSNQEDFIGVRLRNAIHLGKNSLATLFSAIEYYLCKSLELLLFPDIFIT